MKFNNCFSKNLSITFLSIFVFIFFSNDSFAAQNRRSSFRSFGDYMQIINPLFAAGLASQEKGFAHFAIIYSQTFIIMHGTKLIAKSDKWQISKRPHIDNKKDRYEGFPSGHTASAFAGASYVRTFSDEHKFLSIPIDLLHNLSFLIPSYINQQLN